jgi:hypothetical protein
MASSRRGWFGWIEERRDVIGAMVVWVVVISAGIGALVASQSGAASGPAPSLTPQNGGSLGTGPTGTSGTNAPTFKNGRTKGNTNTSTNTTNTNTNTNGNTNTNTNNGGNDGGNKRGNTTPTAPVGENCKPSQPHAANGKPETGISNSTIDIGIIITESNQLPQQFRPLYEGLSAYVNAFNDTGGVCSRTLDIPKADDTPPANSGQVYQQLAQQVFAFVGSSSLFETQWYTNNPPFNPAAKDANADEYVPDIGGLALGFSNNNYTRAQSQYYAGLIGSLSPTMVGGGQFRTWLSSSPGNKCRKAGVVYLNEPTGASKDQATLGAAAIKAKWGGGIPAKLYEMPLFGQTPQYFTLVGQMISDGVNCVFTYADRQSNVNLVHGEAQQGVWPPGSCSATRKASNQCFYLTYMPFTAADEKFVDDAGADGKGVRTFVPHVPFNEGSAPMRQYLAALARCNHEGYEGCDGSSKPSTFSVMGYASGAMFVDAISHCGSAPTRTCVMTYYKGLQDFTAGGLMGPISPFNCTKVSYNGYAWCYKGIFVNSVGLEEKGGPSQGLNAFRRINPASGFFHDKLHIVRGSAA